MLFSFPKYSTEESLAYLGLGTAFFVSLYFVFRYTWTRLGPPTWSQADIACLSCKSVSSIQGVMAVVVGWQIVSACHVDIMHDRHWLCEVYPWFAMPYFYYDTVAEYVEHWHKHTGIHCMNWISRWAHYVRMNKLLFLHHIILPIIFFPTILFLRKGLGDYFVGVFFMIELAVPFLAFRNILVQLQMKHTVLYVISGLFMIGTFLLTRILVFPFLFWKYAEYANIFVWQVPISIPMKCSVGCLTIFLVQFYWLTKMFKGVKRLVLNLREQKKKDR